MTKIVSSAFALTLALAFPVNAAPTYDISLDAGAASEQLVGEDFCLTASFRNTGDTGYGPYYQLILNDDVRFKSAQFLSVGVNVSAEGTFAAAPGNTLVDSLSGQTVVGPEGGTLTTLQYPVGSLVAGQPALDMRICMTLDNNAAIDIAQSDAFRLVPGYLYGDSAVGKPGQDTSFGAPVSHSVTPKLVIYSEDPEEPEVETPPGPDFAYNWTVTANIASNRTTALDFPAVVLPSNVQFVGPVNYNGASCNVVTTPNDPTLAPGAILEFDCPSETGVIGSSQDVVISFPVYHTDTLADNQCAADSTAPNTSKHMTIIKGSSGGDIPGASVTYTLRYEVSEYLENGISAAVITDQLPDGLTFNNDATLVHAGGNVVITPTVTDNSPAAGQTTVVFDVGAVVGTLAASSTGVITYTATIDQSYADSAPVLARDTLSNRAEVVYDTADGALSCSDLSGATITIADVTASKTLMTAGTIRPGDAVTFRLRLDVPSGDSNAISFEDYLPLPVFLADTVLPSSVALTANDTVGVLPVPSFNAAENRITLDFGNISNTSSEVIEVDLTLNVTDTPFADGLFLTNILRAYTNNSPVDNQADLTATGLQVRAPVLSIEKTIESDVSNVDAGDQLDYKVTLTNTGGATAYDVTVFDEPPSSLTSCTVNTIGAGSGDFFDSAAPYTLSNAIAEGASVVITYQCTIAVAAEIGAAITNTASVTWTSQAGSGKFFPALTDEATFNVATPSLTKTVDGSSELVTSAVSGREYLTPGEVVRFRGEVVLPEGTATSAQLRELVPSGFRYIDDGTAAIALVSDGGLSSSLAGSLCTGGTLNHSGSAAAVNPDCVITATGSPFNDSSDAYFALGNLTNSDSDLNDEVIVIEFNVMTLNTRANDENINNYRLRYQASGHGDIDSGVNLKVVKPVMSVTKTVDDANVDAGDMVNYTVTIENAASALLPAQDVELTDVIPAALSYQAGSASVDTTACPASTVQSEDYSDPAGAGLSVQLDSLAIGERCSLRFAAMVSGSVTPNLTITNTAVVAWNNISGGGTNPNSTGSAPGSGISDTTSGSVDITVDNVVNEKSIVSTSDSQTPEGSADTAGDPRRVAVGETLRYRLKVRVPEVTFSGAAVITDKLPAGLQYQTGTARLAFVSDAGGLSSSLGAGICSGGTLASSDENVTPDCAFSVPGAPFSSGEDLVFDLGTLSNSNSDANGEFVIIEYDARVVNESTVQNGSQLANSYDVEVDSVLLGGSTVVVAEVVEPQLSLSISATPNPVDNRVALTPAISWDITISNTGDATAYQLADGAGSFVITLPAGVENITALSLTPTGSVTRNGSAVAVQTSDFSISGTDNTVLTLNNALQIPAGAALLIEFDSSLDAAVIPGQTLSAPVTLSYHSQASGNSSNGVRDAADQPNGTGNTPIGSNAALNDYRVSDSLSVSTQAETLVLESAKAVSVGPTNVGNGEYTLTYRFGLKNSSDVVLTDVQIVDDLNATFTPASWVVNAIRSNEFTVNSGFNGDSNQQLLDNSGAPNTLAINASGFVEMDLTVTPGAAEGNFTNRATASANSARTGAAVSDLSHNGIDGDPDNDGPGNNSDPTPVTLGSSKVLGAAKKLDSVSQNGDDSYDVVFSYVLQNSGNIILNNVQLADDLAAMFAGATSYAVTAISSSDVAVNNSFDGGSDKNLLTSGQSMVAGQQAQLTVTVRVVPGADLGPYENTASASAESPANPVPGTPDVTVYPPMAMTQTPTVPV